MASLFAGAPTTLLAALGLIKFFCFRADELTELTVPAIANTNAIASVISNTNASTVISGSDGLKNE